ncbi:MAG TPA: hypothetical protein PKI19_13065 [Elusimicrobiales bacterium]|nr:hypothetical protein [Elusimicrobiales bacterium]
MILKKKTTVFAVLLAIGGLAYLFSFGKLFVYLPVAFGFSKHETGSVVVFFQQGSSFTDLSRLDSLVKPVEDFHHLRFVRKPKIYVFSDSSSYLRRTITKARFYAYPNGALVISPWAIEEDKAGTISLDIYVRHELSHSLLYQNMGVLAAWRYPAWLMEGIAMYSAGQMGTSWYPSRENTYKMIGAGNYFPPAFYKTRKEDKIKLDVEYRIAFMYSEFGCVVDRLTAVYGEDKFVLYMKTLLSGRAHDEVFREVFGIDYDRFLSDFRSYANNRL